MKISMKKLLSGAPLLGLTLGLAGTAPSAPLPATVDLSAGPGNEGAKVLRVFGKYANGHLGNAQQTAFATGDINGDGIDDLILGQNEASPLGRNQAGEVTVVYGTSTLAPPYQLDLAADTTSLHILGATANGNLGPTAAAGDFNGDGETDLVLSSGGSGSTPLCYVLYGPLSGYSTIDLNAPPPQLKISRILRDPSLSSSNPGQSLFVSDFDGNGADDILLGAPSLSPIIGGQARQYAGVVFMFFGDLARINEATINLSDADATNRVLRIYGDDNSPVGSTGLGYSLAAGDFDGDGKKDLAASEPQNDNAAGRVCIVYNEQLVPGAPLDLGANTSRFTKLVGLANGDATGVGLAAGDINADGFDDLAVGAIGFDYSGTDRGWLILVKMNPTWRGQTRVAGTPAALCGSQPGSRFGIDVSLADVDGDGFADIIAGDSWQSPASARAYVIYGSPTLLTTVDSGSGLGQLKSVDSVLGSERKTTIISPQPGTDLRFGVRSWAGGDINGDGISDFGFTSFLSDNTLQSPTLVDAGAVFSIMGGGSNVTTSYSHNTPMGDGGGSGVVPQANLGPVARAEIDFSDNEVSFGYPKKIFTIELPDSTFHASDVAMSPVDGSLYAFCRSSGGNGAPQVVRYSSSGIYIGTYPNTSLGGVGRGIVLDPTGNYFVCNSQNGGAAIFKYPPSASDGNHLDNFFSKTSNHDDPDPGSFFGDGDIDRDSSGRFYYADYGRGRVAVMNLPSGAGASILRSFGSPFVVPYGASGEGLRQLALGVDGTVYTFQYTGGTTYKIDSFSSFASGNTHIGTLVTDVDLRNLCVDKFGNIYTVKGSPYNHLRKFRPDGSVSVAERTGGSSPFTDAGVARMTVSSDGNIFVANSDTMHIDVFSQSIRSQVSITRQKPSLEPSATVSWSIASDAIDWASARVTFKYLDSEVAGLPETNLALYTSVSTTGPWDQLLTSRDTARNTLSATVTDFGGCSTPGLCGPRYFAIGLDVPASRTEVAGVGDVDGDGNEDFIVGTFKALSNRGEAALVFGPITTPLTNLAQLSLDSLATRGTNAVIRFQGLATGDNLGWSVSGAGDVNGDGKADILIGAPGASRAYLLYGGTRSALATIGLGSLNAGSGILLQGPANSRAGYSVSGAGDVNGDGFADVLIGATQDGNAGRAYLLFGTSGGIAPGNSSLNLDQQTLQSGLGVVISGSAAGDLAGSSLSGAGDVNGDGYADFLVGGYGGSTSGRQGSGKAWIVYGRKSGIGTSGALGLGSLGTTDGVTILGGASGDALGWAVSGAGDVNADGFGDILVSARNANGSAGSLYVIYGRLGGVGSTGSLDLAALANTDGFRITGLATGDLLGASVRSAGDLNGDGFADLVIGAPGRDVPALSDAGAAYVLYGKSTWVSGTTVTVDLATLGSGGVVLNGTAASQGLGTDVSVGGDVDADGVSEALVTSADAGAGQPGFPDFSTAFAFDLTDTGTSPATYKGRASHGVGQTQLDEVSVPAGMVGTTGDGRQSMPFSRLSVGFTGGYTGTAGSPQPSLQTVVLSRSAPIDTPVGSNFLAAPVQWDVTTNRLQFSASTLQLSVLASDLAGLDLTKTGVYFKPSSPLGAGWEATSSTFDANRRVFTVQRAHIKDSAQASFNGTYGIFKGEVTFEEGREIVPPSSVNINDLLASGPEVTPPAAAFWHQYRKRLYAVKSSSVSIKWKNSAGVQVGSTQNGVIQWPDVINATTGLAKFQTHVSNTPAVDLRDGRFQWTQLMDGEAGVDDALVRTGGQFAATGTGRSLILLSESADPQNGDIFFQLVRSVAWNDSSVLQSGTATIGAPIPNDPLHTTAAGSPYVYFAKAPYNAGAGYYDRSARSGEVIPVNQYLTGTNEQMVLVWYERNGDRGNTAANMYSPLTGSIKSNTVGWPFRPILYDCQWPTNPAKIVIAGGQGTGSALSNSTILQPSLYVQSDPTLPGFNPNDEHAFQSGSTIFALRDDLATATTSQPYVLVNYKQAGAGGKNRMFVFQVKAEDGDVTFSRSALAGSALAPLSPIDQQQVCKETTIYSTRFGNYPVSGPYFKDRKANFWAKSAGDNGGQSQVVMRWFYRTKPDFYFPDTYRDALRTLPFYSDTDIPATGNFVRENTAIAWLDRRPGKDIGVPQDVTYTISWPTVPKLEIGETLVRQKYGLPNIKDQPSVEILYQQSTAQLATDSSVQLIDGTRGRYVTITPTAAGDLPDTIRTSRDGTKIILDELPEILRRRLYIDTGYTPNRLYFRGDFTTVVAGEDILLPNVLTQRDIARIKSLDGIDNSRWDARIDALFTSAKLDKGTSTVTSPASTVVTVGSTDKTWETLALTAANATATGYVTLAFGSLDDPRVVPPSTPVSLQVIQVLCPLHRGEIRQVTSSCPFDEKFSMRHNGDFAGGSDNYDFQWYYAPAGGGNAPALPNGSPIGAPDWNAFTPTEHPVTHDPAQGAAEVTLEGGNGALALVDTWWVARYRPRSPLPLLCCGTEAPPETQFYYGDSVDASGNSTEPPLEIPDDDATGVTAQLYVANGPHGISGVTLSFDAASTGCGDPSSYALDHTRIGDLDVTLTSPAGVSKQIVSRPGYDASTAPNGNTGRGLCGTTFTSFATVALGDNSVGPLKAPFTDRWLPVQPLVFSGDADGTWTLTVKDLATGETGVLRRWSLQFDTTGNLCAGTPAPGAEWSPWTKPQLAEGWIKRVMGGINPFTQRITKGGIAGAENRYFDYSQTQVNTVVSMISQAGPRYEGATPLSCKNVDDFGLIEIYETVLRRGMDLSIDNPATNLAENGAMADALFNALQLVDGRLADLYALLGNEAYADSVDPTIAFGTDDGQYGSAATSIHAFMNQTDSLLEEELDLLRGRDDTNEPGVEVQPVYNRLFWNFTNDINGGEVAYALNYNIQDDSGNADGVIDEEDAKKIYPQGHGDAWGHYLTGMTHYYTLLRHPHFVWKPRKEAVSVGGQPVTVDYLDERKFAQLAAAKARTGKEVMDLTYRANYVEDPNGQWQGYKDTDPNRAWGVSEWGTRAGQGAFFDWIAANAMLPPAPTDNSDSDITFVNRRKVSELREISSLITEIQAKMDEADAGMNPLGLARNMVPFDIDPVQIDQGKTHFEQVYDRAVRALNNAITAFNHANNNTQLLRRQSDKVADFQKAVVDREADFNGRLIEIFGYPYADDIGPGGTYPTGYDGPDLYHYDYVDPMALFGDDHDLYGNGGVSTFNVTFNDFDVDSNGGLSSTQKVVTYHLSNKGLGFIKPAEWQGNRRAPGEIQNARSDLMQATWRFQKGLKDYDNLLTSIETAADQLQAQYGLNDLEVSIQTEQLQQTISLGQALKASRRKQLSLRQTGKIINLVQNAVSEGFPQSLIAGLAAGGDLTAPLRAAAKFVAANAAGIFDSLADIESQKELDFSQTKEITQAQNQLTLTTARQEVAIKQQVSQLEAQVRSEATMRFDLYGLQESVNQSAGRYSSALAKGERLLEDLKRFRSQTAAQTQDYRYKDMAFRVFRNDALQKYRAQFDLAARYVYMAAKAYDFESNLLPGDPAGPGQDFLTDIVRARTIGLVEGGQPLADAGSGDPGLADPMARMFLNFDLVLKGQLGFNNPQTETNRFSLRLENLRIQSGEVGDNNWEEQLERYKVSNLFDIPEFTRYCRPFQPHNDVEPGLVIPFSTTVGFGQNFFGFPLGGGDSAYDSSNFATKVRSVGVWFSNYNTLTGSGMSNTPRVYLIPVGDDMMRSPSDDGTQLRAWKILDQKLPVPFPLSPGSLDDPKFIPVNDSLTDTLADLRQYSSFRAYHDSGSFSDAETHKDSRLIGRSVWNTKWLLIIPGGTLNADRNEGLERFIHGKKLSTGQRDGNGVKDIKLFFQTYAYSGN